MIKGLRKTWEVGDTLRGSSEPSVEHPGVDQDEHSNHHESAVCSSDCPDNNSRVAPQASEMDNNHEWSAEGRGPWVIKPVRLVSNVNLWVVVNCIFHEDNGADVDNGNTGDPFLDAPRPLVEIIILLNGTSRQLNQKEQADADNFNEEGCR